MDWIVPANLKYYDVFGELNHYGVIEWRQCLKDVEIGDIVYIYLSQPQAYITFKCVVEKVKIRRDNLSIDDRRYFIGDTLKKVEYYMLLRPIKQYQPYEITGVMIRDAHMPRIQSQRAVCDDLAKIIKSVDKY